jgi:uncharacterized RDD family membrane protein YckC
MEVRPTFTRRVIARVIDLAIIAVVGTVVTTVVGGIDADAADEIPNLVSPGAAPRVAAIILSVAGTWILMIASGALWDGRTPGRFMCRLRIERVGGGPASAHRLLGRDLLRAGSLALALALVMPVAQATATIFTQAGVSDVTLLLAVNAGLPIVATLAIVGGSILSQPDGRGLHDRLAGTVVTREPAGI